MGRLRDRRRGHPRRRRAGEGLHAPGRGEVPGRGAAGGQTPRRRRHIRPGDVAEPRRPDLRRPGRVGRERPRLPGRVRRRPEPDLSREGLRISRTDPHRRHARPPRLHRPGNQNRRGRPPRHRRRGHGFDPHLPHQQAGGLGHPGRREGPGTRPQGRRTDRVHRRLPDDRFASLQASTRRCRGPQEQAQPRLRRECHAQPAADDRHDPAGARCPRLGRRGTPSQGHGIRRLRRDPPRGQRRHGRGRSEGRRPRRGGEGTRQAHSDRTHDRLRSVEGGAGSAPHVLRLGRGFRARRQAEAGRGRHVLRRGPPLRGDLPPGRTALVGVGPGRATAAAGRQRPAGRAARGVAERDHQRHMEDPPARERIEGLRAVRGRREAPARVAGVGPEAGRGPGAEAPRSGVEGQCRGRPQGDE